MSSQTITVSVAEVSFEGLEPSISTEEFVTVEAVASDVEFEGLIPVISGQITREVSTFADLQNIGRADDLGDTWSDGLDDDGNPTNKYDEWKMYDRYIQINDIDLDEANFHPIGHTDPTKTASSSDIEYFTGTYDGQGHKLHNGKIEWPNGDWISLFSFIDSGAEIKNLKVSLSVKANRQAAGITSTAYNSQINNCSMAGDVETDSVLYAPTGGIVGVLVESSVENCYCTGNITAKSGPAGGLAAQLTSGTIGNCYSTGDVVTATTSTYQYTGGFVGRVFSDGTISDCYATGNVEGHDLVGGFVGGCNGAINNCYSLGTVSSVDRGGAFSGGFIAATGADNNNYWDVDTSGIGTDGSTNESSMGTGKSTVNMQKFNTFDPEWDIITVTSISEEDRNTDKIWNIVDESSYPFLSWQVTSVNTSISIVTASIDFEGLEMSVITTQGVSVEIVLGSIEFDPLVPNIVTTKDNHVTDIPPPSTEFEGLSPTVYGEKDTDVVIEPAEITFKGKLPDTHTTTNVDIENVKSTIDFEGLEPSVSAIRNTSVEMPEEDIYFEALSPEASSTQFVAVTCVEALIEFEADTIEITGDIVTFIPIPSANISINSYPIGIEVTRNPVIVIPTYTLPLETFEPALPEILDRFCLEEIDLDFHIIEVDIEDGFYIEEVDLDFHIIEVEIVETFYLEEKRIDFFMEEVPLCKP